MTGDADITKVGLVAITGTVGTITLTDVNEIAAFILVLVSIVYTTAKLIRLLKKDE